jgi:hypothetical protein
MRLMQFFAAVALGMAFAIPATAHEGGRGHEAPAAAQTASGHAVETVPRPAVGELAALRMHLTQPEYWHVLIHPFPILGMLLAAPLLLFALAVRSRGAHEAGLVLILLSALGAFVTVKIGQRAYDRVYKGIESESQQWLDVHMERAEDAQWAFYLTGLLAALALAAGRRKPFWERPATIGALSGALLCSALGGWIAHAGGQVRHAEFRFGPPIAPARAEGMHHEH